ncbi:MAG: RES family NAD+ phosphorylase [Bacteroidales bacterium]|nr:RES family NAD+ phosphorylase [Bacteroidales bacterium]
MIVFRLANRKFSHDLSGKGAEITGGRWNSKGVGVVYTSESRALCTAEIAVHTQLGIIPKDYELVHILIPDSIQFMEISPDELPLPWNSIPYNSITQNIGNHFIDTNEYPVLKVPSAVIPGDFNYLINPAHPDSRGIEITKTEAFSFDERLFKR